MTITQPREYNVIIKWYCVTKAKTGRRQGKPRRDGMEKSRVNSRYDRRNEKGNTVGAILNVSSLKCSLRNNPSISLLRHLLSNNAEWSLRHPILHFSAIIDIKKSLLSFWINTGTYICTFNINKMETTKKLRTKNSKKAQENLITLPPGKNLAAHDYRKIKVQKWRNDKRHKFQFDRLTRRYLFSPEFSSLFSFQDALLRVYDPILMPDSSFYASFFFHRRLPGRMA